MSKLEPHFRLRTEVATLKSSELPEVARLYEAVFGDHFLGHMGQEFLQRFCAQFCNFPTNYGNYGYVAKYDGKVVGFVLGSCSREPFARFYRQNFWKLTTIVLKQYFKDAYVRKHVLKRLSCVADALKSYILRRRSEPAPVASTSTPTSTGTSTSAETVQNESNQPRILAIGVDGSYRGQNIAGQLTGFFCEKMKEAGYVEVGLSAVPENTRAIRFYKKDGWIVTETSEDSVNFVRSIV